MKYLKLIFCSSVLLLSCTHFASAQEFKENLVGHYKNEYFVLKEHNYYVVEQLSPLKYNNIKYDTLLPTNNTADSFQGEVYALHFESNILCLIKREYQREVMRLKPIDDEVLKERNRKHNFFYYKPYEIKIFQYARLLKKENKSEYERFSKDREELYDKINELSINDFQTCFISFLKKHALE